MFYNKQATIFRFERDDNTWITEYKQIWNLKCNIQPLDSKEWLDWWIMLKQKKIYFDTNWLIVWDKLVVDNINYIIDYIQHWDWLKRNYYKAIATMSEWN